MSGHAEGSRRSRRLRRLLILGAMVAALLVFRSRQIAESESRLAG